eukprot:IDg14189t1
MFHINEEPCGSKLAAGVSDGFLLFDSQPRWKPDGVWDKAGLLAMDVALKNVMLLEIPWHATHTGAPPIAASIASSIFLAHSRLGPSLSDLAVRF